MKLLHGRKSLRKLEGSKFSDRIFIKHAKNRKTLREAAEKSEWPSRRNITQTTEKDPDFRPNMKRKRNIKKDEGMEMFWKLLESTNKSNPPTSGFVKLMLALSAKTSSTILFQVIDVELIQNIKAYLKSNTEMNFIEAKTSENLIIYQKI